MQAQGENKQKQKQKTDETVEGMKCSVVTYVQQAGKLHNKSGVGERKQKMF
jgi:general stress protein 26